MLKNIQLNEESPFCKDPIKAVCENNKYSSFHRIDRRLAFIKAARLKALRNTATEIGENPDTFTREKLEEFSWTQKKRALGILDQKLEAEVQFQVQTMQKKINIKGLGQQAKDLLKKTITNNSSLHMEQKDNLIKSIQSVDILTPEEVLSWQNGSEGLNATIDIEYKKIIFERFENNCGPGGLEDGAYNSTIVIEGKKTREFIIICPGYFISSIDNANSEEVLIRMISHELGHKIDFEHEWPIYKNYQKCLLNNYLNDVLSLENTKKGWEWFTDVVSSPIQGVKKMYYQYVLGINYSWENSTPDYLRSKIGEITADYWSIQTFIEFMKTKPELSHEDKMDYFRKQFGSLCGSSGDKHHPGEKFRLGIILRTTPGIIKLMDCASDKAKPACAL